MELNEASFLEGLRGLQVRGELCDIAIVAGGKRFLAHQVVLAAASSNFVADVYVGRKMVGSHTQAEITLAGITHGEAVQVMLDYVYSAGKLAVSYTPSSVGTTADIIRLALAFQLQGLQDGAVQWLAREMDAISFPSTYEECVSTCEEFGLHALKKQMQSTVTRRDVGGLDVEGNTPRVGKKTKVKPTRDADLETPSVVSRKRKRTKVFVDSPISVVRGSETQDNIDQIHDEAQRSRDSSWCAVERQGAAQNSQPSAGLAADLTDALDYIKRGETSPRPNLFAKSYSRGTEVKGGFEIRKEKNVEKPVESPNVQIKKKETQVAKQPRYGCDFHCGFIGNFDAVAVHEKVCTEGQRQNSENMQKEMALNAAVDPSTPRKGRGNAIEASQSDMGAKTEKRAKVMCTSSPAKAKPRQATLTELMPQEMAAAAEHHLGDDSATPSCDVEADESVNETLSDANGLVSSQKYRSGWVILTFRRRGNNDKSAQYHVFQAPSGKRYRSKRQAQEVEGLTSSDVSIMLGGH